jgi:hypothetical protein
MGNNDLAVRESADLAAQQTQHQDGSVQVASTRASQEIQAAMVIAKKCPRDQEAAYARLIKACKRKGLAETALYAYPRGGTTVTGPSIRLAEEAARNWGNLQYGITELEQRNGESTVLAFCWDLETNVQATKTFQVKHERKAHGGMTRLTDPRDIYEMVANNGARRLRACILGVIPGDIIEAAVEQCEKTMATAGGEIPLIDRVRKMVVAFAETASVDEKMLEKRLGHKLAACSEIELSGLRKIFVSLRDGMSKREDWFGEGVTEKASISLDQLKPGTPDSGSGASVPAVGGSGSSVGPDTAPAASAPPAKKPLTSSEPPRAEQKSAAAKKTEKPAPRQREPGEDEEVG